MAQPPKPRGGGFVYFAKWKTYLNLAILTLGILFALPNLFTDEQLASLPSWITPREDEPRPRSAGRLAPPDRSRCPLGHPRSPRNDEGRDARHCCSRRATSATPAWMSAAMPSLRRSVNPADARQGPRGLAADTGQRHDRSTIDGDGQPATGDHRSRASSPGNVGRSSNRSRSSAAASTRGREGTDHSAPGRRPHPRPGSGLTTIPNSSKSSSARPRR